MLLLSRRKNQGLVINNDITVTVIELRKDNVLLAVVAPRDASVHRQEVFDAIHGRPAAPLANRPEAWLDRVAAALQAKTGVPVSRGLLEQAIQDADMQESGAEG